MEVPGFPVNQPTTLVETARLPTWPFRPLRLSGDRPTPAWSAERFLGKDEHLASPLLTLPPGDDDATRRSKLGTYRSAHIDPHPRIAISSTACELPCGLGHSEKRSLKRTERMPKNGPRLFSLSLTPPPRSCHTRQRFDSHTFLAGSTPSHSSSSPLYDHNFADFHCLGEFDPVSSALATLAAGSPLAKISLSSRACLLPVEIKVEKLESGRECCHCAEDSQPRGVQGPRTSFSEMPANQVIWCAYRASHAFNTHSPPPPPKKKDKVIRQVAWLMACP
ncbi:hypothetical protein LX36DRAFT_201063 [Colletotrichum falcatum]|nr:hypothetical protein LX36DRAFT_201063 [Colletotrichum falcatum]